MNWGTHTCTCSIYTNYRFLNTNLCNATFCKIQYHWLVKVSKFLILCTFFLALRLNYTYYTLVTSRYTESYYNNYAACPSSTKFAFQEKAIIVQLCYFTLIFNIAPSLWTQPWKSGSFNWKHGTSNAGLVFFFKPLSPWKKTWEETSDT